MAHLVKRKGYWSLEESYRDANGKPRKRYLKYLGKLGQIDWAGTFKSESGMAAAERAMEEAEARPVVEPPSKLPDGLHVGPVDPVLAEAAEVKDNAADDDAKNDGEGGGDEDGEDGGGSHIT